MSTATVAPAPAEAVATFGAFQLRLDNFEGPFDLLLSLITRRKLDVTEVALSQVTDEFISYLAAAGTWDLGQATEFLVIASTLLDLKAARLLPSADVEDEEDLALLEARDLLFARLLQYRAYKLAAAWFGELERTQARRHGRSAELEPRFAEMLPELRIGVDPLRFAAIAAAAMAVRPVPTVGIEHVHTQRVSVAEHMAVLRERVRAHGSVTFRTLVADCATTLEVVARFLGLLELYREGAVAFDQAGALTELRVRWVGGDAGPGDVPGRRRGVPVTDLLPQPELATADPAQPELATADPAQPELATADPAQPELATADPAQPELATADPIQPELATADPIQLRAALEAVLFVLDSPVTAQQLAAAVRRTEADTRAALTELAAELDAPGSGIELREVAGGVRLYTRPEHADVVAAFLLDGQRSKLSQAALETLAVIAYRQPVTRARIAAIRGVSVDGVVRTLLSRGLIVEAGPDPDTGGGRYRTTALFLEKMGLHSLDELPSLAPLLPDLNGLDGMDGMAGLDDEPDV